MPVPEAADTRARMDFKSDMDVGGLERPSAAQGADRIPLSMITMTNNSVRRAAGLVSLFSFLFSRFREVN